MPGYGSYRSIISLENYFINLFSIVYLQCLNRLSISVKQEILSTALNHFSKYGVRKTSIQSLATSLGISTKTVYKYFDDKEKLLGAALQLFYSHHYQLLNHSLADGSPVVQLYDIWYQAIEGEYGVHKGFFTELHHYYPELARKLERKNAIHFWKKFVEIVHLGIESGVFRKDVNPLLALESIAALYESIVRHGKFKKFKVSQYSILMNSITLLLRGMSTALGVQQLENHLLSKNIIKSQTIKLRA